MARYGLFVMIVPFNPNQPLQHMCVGSFLVTYVLQHQKFGSYAYCKVLGFGAVITLRAKLSSVL